MIDAAFPTPKTVSIFVIDVPRSLGCAAKIVSTLSSNVKNVSIADG